MHTSIRLRIISVCLLTLSLFFVPASAQAKDSGSRRGVDDNAALVRAAFDNWREGRGSVFDLLADDAEWTVAGSSPVSGVYRGRQDFIQRAVAPIQARLVTPITPNVRHIVSQGNAVVVIWDGTATARDGRTYTNSYAWHLELEEGRIIRATAFLDTWALNTLVE
jgi:uncharacterized protein